MKFDWCIWRMKEGSDHPYWCIAKKLVCTDIRHEHCEDRDKVENGGPCPECKGTKLVDWHYLDGEVKMERCPRCSGSGKEPKVMFPYGDKKPREVII